MPRLVFTAGEVLQAATMNDLSDQSVMVFAGTAARGSAIPSPSEGMVTYRSDDDLVEVFNGSVFAPVGVEPAILQVVSTTKTDAFTTTTRSFIDITGLSATITPTSTSSKILVVANVSMGQTAGNGDHFLRLLREAVVIGSGTSGSTTNGFISAGGGASNGMGFSGSITFLDTPSTTSATTYKIQSLSTSGTSVVNRREVDGTHGYSSHITVMEVAG